MQSQNGASSGRRYTSELRAQQAAATRERVVASATALFSQRGYAATTMPEIARRAGVSTETVQANGPKQALLRAAINASTFGGENDTDARDTELGALMLAVTSAAQAATVTAGILTQVNASVHGLWLSLSEAARHDAGMAAELQGLAVGIRTQNTILMSEWRRRGYLRDDIPFEDLVDRGVLVGSVEVYDRAVRIGGMSPEEYTAMLASLVADLLLKR